MKIRFATFDDLESLVEIYNQAILAGQKTADTMPFSVKDRIEWFQSYSPEKYPLIVALENNKVIGYLTLSAYRYGRPAVAHTLEVSFYIHFSHQRKGVALQLLNQAIKLCHSLHITSLVALLIESNIGSIKLLEQFNFELWGCMPDIIEFENKKYDHLYYGLKISQ